MYNLSKKRIAFWIFVVVLFEIVVQHYFFDKRRLQRGSKKVKAYKLLSAKDLEEKGPSFFEKVFPQFSENVTSLNDFEANYSLNIRPVFEENNMFVLFMVNSMPERFEQRHLIRTTWANTWTGSKKNGKAATSRYKGRQYPKLFSYCIFLVGVSNTAKYDLRVSQEASVLGDIFRVDLKEKYLNNVDKIWKAYAWALNAKTKYIFKVEDGVYVNIPRMVQWLKEDKDLPENLYAGHVVHRHPIDSEADRQFGDDSDEPATLPRLVLPNYCIGSFYVFSANILQSLLVNSRKTEKIQVGEDAYMGLITKDTYVLPYNVGNRLFVLDGSRGALAIEYTEEKLKQCVYWG